MTTRLVATTLVRRPRDVVELLVSPPAGVDYLELRLDTLEEPVPATVAELFELPRSIPVIATCRAAAQGGAYPGDEADRLALLAAAGEAGADVLDVEDTSLPDFPASVPGERLASCHLKRFMPRLDALARRVGGRGTALAKLAVPADTPKQLATLLALQEELPDTMAIVPTGRLAEAGRVMAAGRGSALCYGAAVADDPGHPDQPSVARLHDVFHISLVGPTTRFFAVVGRPVSHSMSPVFHNCVFRGIAMPARMVPMDVDDLPDLLEHADELHLDGCAVTHPFKRDAFDAASTVLPGARTTGAANTLTRTPAGWQARNTDWKAACDLLPRLLRGWRRRGSARKDWLKKVLDSCWHGGGDGSRAKDEGDVVPRVLLLGSGGAARAVAVALFEEDVELAIWSRRLSHARDLATKLADTIPALAIPEPSHFPADVIVNATPIGMAGVDGQELDLFGADNFRPGAVAIDLTYGTAESPFRRAVADAGARLVSGEFFFGLQARRQAEVFTQGAVPAEIRREAARRCGLAG